MAGTRGGPPRFLGMIIGLVTLAIVGVVALVVLKVCSALKEDWKDVGARTAEVAATTKRQLEAGEAYKGQLEISMAKTPSFDNSTGKMTLVFRVKNNGDKAVLRASADVTFGAVEGGRAHRENVLVFDDSPQSVMTGASGRSLLGGEEREITIRLKGEESWDVENVSVEFAGVRVSDSGGGAREGEAKGAAE